MLSSLSQFDEVDNVLVYISDSLRFDYLPERVKSRSTWGRAIAASTFTGSGYPSIMTGKYPANHKVWELTETLRGKPPILQVLPHSGVDATWVWGTVSDPANKPPIRMCHETENTTLSDVESPFALIVHDTGGHMLYGGRNREDWDSHDEFFNDLRGEPERIKELYQTSVTESLDRLFELCDELQFRGDLENTLVVLTSDHGELLGEYGGLYDHGSPIAPELVSVPLAFLGAGLPTDHRIEPLCSTTDIVPTAFSALGKSLPEDVDGVDLWNSESASIEDRILRSEIWKDPDYPLMSYQATSGWTGEGGVVRHLNSLRSRFAYMLAYEYYYTSYANIVRWPMRTSPKHWAAYLKETNIYRNPPDTISESLPKKFLRKDPEDEILGGPNKQQLRDLGYLK